VRHHRARARLPFRAALGACPPRGEPGRGPTWLPIVARFRTVYARQRGRQVLGQAGAAAFVLDAIDVELVVLAEPSGARRKAV
jgi:hypothetical protein